MNGSTQRTLTADTVSLMQVGAFDAAFAGPSGMFTLTVNSELTLTTADSQMVHDWMVDDGRTLSLTTTGVIMIGRDIAAGSGSITLNGDTLVFSDDAGAARTLSGTNITLNGEAMSTVALNLTASGTGTPDAQ